MSGEIIITSRGIRGSFAPLAAQLQRAAIKGLQRAAYDMIAVAVQEVDASAPRPPVNLGQLKRSFRVQATPTGAIAENTSPQAVWMEYGTRPHWAPLRPLLAWAMQKARGGGVGNAYALAKGAQMSIAERGTAPRRFWARTLTKMPEIVRRRLEEALSRAGSVAA